MSRAVSIPEALALLDPEPGLVVLMCGLAGSGKTTFSRRLEDRGFVRVAIDELVWRSAGRYGIDYPAEAYGEKLAAAREVLKTEVERLLAGRRAVVVDSAFWSRAHRDAYAALAARHGARCRIVYLEASRALLKSRLAERSRRFDANAALPIDEAQLDRFIASFDAPSPEENALVVAA